MKTQNDSIGIGKFYRLNMSAFRLPLFLILLLGVCTIANASTHMGIGQTKSLRVYANVPLNETNIYMEAGEKYEFSVAAADRWKSGSRETNADGYQPTTSPATRHPDLPMMTLIGEIFTHSTFVTYLQIGTSRTWTASMTGNLYCYANDTWLTYGNNSGSVILKIKRIS